MTYKELKRIAEPHIRKGDNLPSNALLLLTQLHIPYKTEKQCREDFKNKHNPLDDHPAFLYVGEDKNKTLYFNTATQYWNFYIFHEIAHYLLGHEDNSPQHEMDANLLACILTAPIENLPTYLKIAEDLSALCKIPIDKAEEYWQEIRDIYFEKVREISSRKNKKIFHILKNKFSICIIIASILLGILVYKLLNPHTVYIDNLNIGHLTRLCPSIVNRETLKSEEYKPNHDQYYEHCTTCHLLKNLFNK